MRVWGCEGVRFVSKSGLKIMKKLARDHPEDGLGAVRRGGACGGSPGAEKGPLRTRLLGIFLYIILMVFLCFV